MSGIYQSKKEQRYQSELAAMFSDVEPPVEERTESADEFSLEPIGFAELAENLCRDAEALFSMTSTRHRLSEAFLTATANLEKLIRRLGSCCLTKAALESKGQALPALEGLDIRKLYCLGSFNFRKCHASIRDGIRKAGCFNMDMMNMECSWANTLERLQATEERIALIREGKINVDSLLRRDGLFRERDASAQKNRNGGSTAFAKAASFPILRTALEGTAAYPADLGVGTSREPKTKMSWGDAKIFSPISPAMIRKEIEKERREKEAREKALRETEDEERSKQAVEETVTAMIRRSREKRAAENKTAGEAFKTEREKSALEKWNEILGSSSPPEERSAPGSGRRGHERKKRKKQKG